MSQRLRAMRRRRAPCSHAFPTFRVTITSVCVALLSSCALINRPEPVTTLQLPLNATGIIWPGNLETGKVTAASALQSDRVLVTHGALLMQHEGVRWVDVPATLLTEHLRMRQTGTEASALAETKPVAALDIWLTEFNIRIADGGSKTVVVSASGELRCTHDERRLRIAPAVARHSLNAADGTEIAAAFAQATDEMVTTLLSMASVRASACAATAPRMPSNSLRP